MRLPSGANATGVGPELLEQWYAKRIETEGRWRTFARINSDSGHACSSTLHAKALGSTYDKVWRYFFDYVEPGSKLREFLHCLTLTHHRIMPADISIEQVGV